MHEIYTKIHNPLSPRCVLETDNQLNSLTSTTVTTNCPLHFVHAKENRIVDSTDNRFNVKRLSTLFDCENNPECLWWKLGTKLIRVLS